MAAVEVFMDTAGFLALWDAGDATSCCRTPASAGVNPKTPPFPHDRICGRRNHHSVAGAPQSSSRTDFLDTIERSEALRLEWIDPARFHIAANWFRKHGDKQWSFTDCVSFAVMRELRDSRRFHRRIIIFDRPASLLFLKPRGDARTAGNSGRFSLGISRAARSGKLSS